MIRIKDLGSWRNTRAASGSGLPLLSARSPHTDRAPTCSSWTKARPWGGQQSIGPYPGGGAECGPRRPWSYLPEPLNDRVVWAVAVLVDGMLSPVIHVHIAKAAHQQLGKREQNCKRGTTSMPKKSHAERWPFSGPACWPVTETNAGNMWSTFYLPRQTRQHP